MYPFFIGRFLTVYWEVSNGLLGGRTKLFSKGRYVFTATHMYVKMGKILVGGV
jgi:hypothetical protein